MAHARSAALDPPDGGFLARPRPPPAMGEPGRALPVGVRHRDRRHHRQRGSAHHGARARSHHQPTAVDRRRLHPGVRRSASRRRQPGRPIRPPPRPRPRPGLVRRHLGAGRLRPDTRPAHRRPGRHGRRGRADLPGHAGHPQQRVPGTRRAGQGHRHLGRRQRPVGRGRTGDRWLPARALLVGLGVPRQRPDRHRRPGSRSDADPRFEGPARQSDRPARSGALGRRRDPVWCGPSSKHPAGDGPRPASCSLWRRPPG